MKRNKQQNVNNLTFWETVAATVLRKLAKKVSDAKAKQAAPDVIDTTFEDVTNPKLLPPHEN